LVKNKREPFVCSGLVACTGTKQNNFLGQLFRLSSTIGHPLSAIRCCLAHRLLYIRARNVAGRTRRGVAINNKTSATM
jgi:hypothetical protein